MTIESNSHLTINPIKIKNNKLYFTVNKGKSILSRKITKNGKKSFISYKGDIFIIKGNPVLKTKGLTPLKNETKQSEFPINQRFEFLKKFVNMVLDKITPSIIVTGEGGLGKSHTVLTEIEKRKMKEDEDYIIIKGYVTPKALYSTLYENRDKTIIFDDCDSVLKDPTSLNLLKGALDSYDKRIISWLQKGFIDDGLPSSFEFQGNVIFISNMSSEKIDQAIRSRSITIDLSMTIKDKIERMQAILNDILPSYDIKIKQQVLDFMADHADIAVEFNIRTLQKLIKTCYAYNGKSEWKEAGKYLLTNI